MDARLGPDGGTHIQCEGGVEGNGVKFLSDETELLLVFCPLRVYSQSETGHIRYSTGTIGTAQGHRVVKVLQNRSTTEEMIRSGVLV